MDERPSRGRLLARPLTVVSTLVIAVLYLAGTALAGPVETPETTGGPERATLAATGLDVTVPVIIGVALLLLGTAAIAFVALRSGRPSHRSG